MLASQLLRLPPDAPGGEPAPGHHGATVDVEDERFELTVRSAVA